MNLTGNHINIRFNATLPALLNCASTAELSSASGAETCKTIIITVLFSNDMPCNSTYTHVLISKLSHLSDFCSYFCESVYSLVELRDWLKLETTYQRDTQSGWNIIKTSNDFNTPPLSFNCTQRQNTIHFLCFSPTHTLTYADTHPLPPSS